MMTLDALAALSSQFDPFKQLYSVVLEPLGLGEIEYLCLDASATAYAGLSFVYAGQKYLFRQVKITPTKLGGFVTLWTRDQPNLAIRPFNEQDGIDGVIIANANQTDTGYFFFDRATLVQHQVFTQNGIEGKRALRLYEPWLSLTAKQAIHSQKWQSEHFIALSETNGLNKAQSFFTCR
ncbi:MepB family protein [Acinetobacter sp. MD2]|uniref:MepB family protein n=1 Tax=Acinetobacter sp. MD2 TaxID=2600066 RepID=UPI002D1F4952|nr:MepB family protein [Acinetobacter sp. MD2]MEB3767497.1 MepB family protein [Acinetobacter sp. MD2]